MVGGHDQLARVPQPLGGDVLDVRIARRDRGHLALVDVDRDDSLPGLGERHCEGQTHVAQTNYPNRHEGFKISSYDLPWTVLGGVLAVPCTRKPL